MALDKSAVDSTMKEILDIRRVSEKTKKKKAERFFHFLGGGDSPIEAVELALGRNEKLQYAQIKAVTEIVKFLDQFGETRVSLYCLLPLMMLKTYVLGFFGGI
jgi:hypothetical protein